MARATSSFSSLAAALSLFAVAPGTARANSAARHVVPLADGWRFLRADVAGAEGIDFDDRTWARVRVPHTWNAQDGADGGNDYYRGVGWYRRRQPIAAS